MDRYHFRLTVNGESYKDIDEVLDWCCENFGKSIDYDSHIKQVINEIDQNIESYNEHRWTFLPTAGCSVRILFSNEIDVAAFRLRWL